MVQGLSVRFCETPVGGLGVEIETSRIVVRSVVETDLEDITLLFQCPETMRFYANGQCRDEFHTRRRVMDVWIPRWARHDPRGGLCVFEKQPGSHILTFVGVVVLGAADESQGCGCAELAYVLKRECWGRGLGSEAVRAMLSGFALEVWRREYDYDGAPLRSIVATARCDNIPSCKILEKQGFVPDGMCEKYGSVRVSYRISIDELLIRAAGDVGVIQPPPSYAGYLDA
eukprot:ANDGO_00810.mRNA.1 hypothetical protein DICPUDRAFT_156344